MATQLQDARQALEESREDLLDRRNVVAVGVGRKVVEGRETDELAIIASVIAKRPREALPPGDLIARLSEWVPLEFDNGSGDGGGSPCAIAGAAAGILNTAAAAVGSRTRLRPVRVDAAPAAAANLVDCAIAEPLDEAELSNEVLQIGTIAGLAEGTLGMSIKKSGRTTGFTTGTIQQIDVTAQVNYGAGRIATFVDPLLAGPMSQGGDSGSAVLNEANELVGLLFAGSINSTIINRIQNVFSALQLSLP